MYKVLKGAERAFLGRSQCGRADMRRGERRWLGRRSTRGQGAGGLGSGERLKIRGLVQLRKGCGSLDCILPAEGAVEGFRADLWTKGIVRRVDFAVRFRVHEGLK